ncbi:hypothetical protein E2C01_008559 [Portunus trituberculatus]|uniref:Uncharacterized protein n=1 Tax=Portunus trituberculatus TaxID=210409 RepID=A0A5B7D146_PORTR|nr:hypothetical protein [Portunus trituberculatus]
MYYFALLSFIKVERLPHLYGNLKQQAVYLPLLYHFYLRLTNVFHRQAVLVAAQLCRASTTCHGQAQVPCYESYFTHYIRTQSQDNVDSHDKLLSETLLRRTSTTLKSLLLK